MLVLFLFVVAVVCIYLELFLPGGVFGIIGVGALVASIVLGFARYHEMGAWIAVGELLIATVLIVIGLKYFRHGPASKFLILGRSLDKKDGFTGTEALEGYVGEEGVSVTHLRPAGIAKVGSTRLDVVSEGSFIGKGKKLKVVAVEGNRVVVREIESTT